MKVLLYTPNYLPATRFGGPVRSVHGLARALVELGHEVTVFTTDLNGVGGLHVPLGKCARLDGVTVRYFPIASPKRLYYSPMMGKALALQAKAFDVVHVNGVFLWPGVRAGVEAARAGVPLVLSPRGMLVEELISARSTLAKRLWIAAFERRNIARASAVHVTSEIEALELSKLGLPVRQLALVPNGVEPPKPLPSRAAQERHWRGAPGGRRIAFAARLDWKKGVDVAIEAAAALPDVHLRLAGPDEGTLRSGWEQRLRDRGLADRIRFVGELQDPEKWEFLQGADITVVPSVNENFGNVVVESMAVGTPVICTEGVGAASVVRQVDSGLVIPRTTEALAKAMAALLEDGPRRSRAARVARDLMATEFTWTIVARQMLKVYSHGYVD